jgi:hypothetical protein
LVLQSQAFVKKGIGLEGMIGQYRNRFVDSLFVAIATELRGVEVNVEERSQATKHAE